MVVKFVKWFEEHYFVSLAITLFGAFLIYYISSLTFESSGRGMGLKAILYHILAFFSFGFFVFVTLVRGRKSKVLFATSFLISFAYSITDELHQFFVPGRACAIFDIFLDLVGISFAFILYLILVICRKK